MNDIQELVKLNTPRLRQLVRETAQAQECDAAELIGRIHRINGKVDLWAMAPPAGETLAQFLGRRARVRLPEAHELLVVVQDGKGVSHHYIQREES